MTARVSLLAASFVAIMAVNVVAQQQTTPPLAEVARQAEAAKPTARKATKTYTNSDLSPDPKPSAPAPDPSSGFVSRSLGKAVPPEEMVERSKAAVEREEPSKESEETWRMRATSLRTEIDLVRTRLAELTRSNASREESPAVRAGNANEIATARAALEGLRKRWTKLESSARELKLPMAWLEPLPQFQ